MFTVPCMLQMVLFKNDDDLGVLGFNPGIRSQRRKEVNLSKISILIVIGNSDINQIKLYQNNIPFSLSSANADSLTLITI